MLIKVGCQAGQVAMTLPLELPIWEGSLEVGREDVAGSNLILGDSGAG